MNTKRKAPSFARSPCPIAVTLDLIGDKWSLVIVRDVVAGKRRFLEFLSSPEGIKRNILADRLKRLEAAGVIEKLQYEKHPPRFEYLLTDKGCDLLPVLQELARWATKHAPGVWRPSLDFYARTPKQLASALRDNRREA
jgi:DNA-binding HxlR family transcriptional regulator